MAIFGALDRRVGQLRTGPDLRAIRKWSIIAFALEIGVIVLFASQFPWSTALATIGAAGIVSLAAFSGGIFFGFLFGLPRTSENIEPSPGHPVEAVPAESVGSAPDELTNRYHSNTNLEQISDWLTKILVGAGLVQLAALPRGAARLSATLKPLLGGSAASGTFGVTLVVYDLVTGFLVGYLLTRLCLVGALTGADQDILERENDLKHSLALVPPTTLQDQVDLKGGPTQEQKQWVSSLKQQVQTLEKQGGRLDATSYINLAKQLKSAGDYRSAEQAATAAADLDPSNPDAYRILGLLRGKYLKEYDQAQGSFLQAISRDPTDMSTFYNMACNSMRQGNIGEALNFLSIAINGDPQRYRDLAIKDSEDGEVLSPLKGNQQFEALIRPGVTEGATEDGDSRT